MIPEPSGTVPRTSTPASNGNNNNNGRDPKKQSIIIMITAAVLSLLCISYFTRAVSGATTVEISYNKFIETDFTLTPVCPLRRAFLSGL